MFLPGIILSFDHTQGSGLIMLFNGERKEFKLHDWIDDIDALEAGVKVSCQDDGIVIKVKRFSEEDEGESSPQEERAMEEEIDINRFTSLQEYKSYFFDQGYDVVETDGTGTDELVMEKSDAEGVQRVVIGLKNAKPELTRQTIRFSSMDDHIDHFKEMGYKLVRDVEEKGSRTATLRRFSVHEHSEIIIKSADSKLTVTKTLNGQKVY